MNFKPKFKQMNSSASPLFPFSSCYSHTCLSVPDQIQYGDGTTVRHDNGARGRVLGFWERVINVLVRCLPALGAYSVLVGLLVRLRGVRLRFLFVDRCWRKDGLVC